MLTVIKKEGDLIKLFQEGSLNAIGHGCNCFSKMGKGIAYAIKQKWPEAYQADIESRLSPTMKLGGYTRAVVKEGYIYNIYSQFKYSNYEQVVNWNATIDALISVVEDLISECIDNFSTITLGIPYIGCNNAGGKEEDLLAVLEDIEGYFAECPYTIEIHLIRKI